MTRTLIRAGAFLSAYELIRLQVVDGVRDFYWTGREDNGKEVLYPDYETDVRARDKSVYTASVSWLVEGGALTQQQADVLEEVHQHRHEVAHELPRILIDPDFEVNSAFCWRPPSSSGSLASSGDGSRSMPTLSGTTLRSATTTYAPVPTS
jgi:hypothetical protein